jgi:hypothetical protein
VRHTHYLYNLCYTDRINIHSYNPTHACMHIYIHIHIHIHTHTHTHIYIFSLWEKVISYWSYIFLAVVVECAGRKSKRMVLLCINGVSSNPVEGRTKIWQLKDLILTLSSLIFRRLYTRHIHTHTHIYPHTYTST